MRGLKVKSNNFEFGKTPSATTYVKHKALLYALDTLLHYAVRDKFSIDNMNIHVELKQDLRDLQYEVSISEEQHETGSDS
jgi:hypothetical protein